jgi:hypothetical protein
VVFFTSSHRNYAALASCRHKKLARVASEERIRQFHEKMQMPAGRLKTDANRK